MSISHVSTRFVGSRLFFKRKHVKTCLKLVCWTFRSHFQAVIALVNADFCPGWWWRQPKTSESFSGTHWNHLAWLVCRRALTRARKKQRSLCRSLRKNLGGISPASSTGLFAGTGASTGKDPPWVASWQKEAIIPPSHNLGLLGLAGQGTFPKYQLYSIVYSSLYTDVLLKSCGMSLHCEMH